MKKFIVELDDDSCCYFQNPVYHVCRVTGNFCNVDRICERPEHCPMKEVKDDEI